MRRFSDVLKGLGGVLLLGGFLWLGVPRCSEVEGLTAGERQVQAALCAAVLREHLVTLEPGMLTVGEWRAALAQWQAACALDDADLRSREPRLPDHAGEVLDRLARRVRGR